MQPRIIVRHPKIFSTPKAFAEAFGVKTRSAERERASDWNRDFFMGGYPSPHLVRNAPDYYPALAAFFSANKRDQRVFLGRMGLPTPVVGQPPYVVRPLRHQGGEGWRITQDRRDFNPEREYIASVFPKTNEYRLVYVHGTLQLMLTKIRANPEVRLGTDVPWNHGNTQFQTIPIETSNLLTHTDCLQRLLNNRIIREAHYVGVDVLYNRRSRDWVICEFNSSPALQIPENREKIVNFLRSL